MKVKLVAVLAATTALAFTTAGAAAAQSRGPANQRESAAAAQVTGVRLQTAVLPTSAFGADFKFSEALNSGSKLQSSKAKHQPSSMSCNTFEGRVYIGTFGDTAGVVSRYTNPDWPSEYPNTILLGDQYVLQFVSSSAAATFYSQIEAKYAACKTLSEPFLKVTAEVDTLSVTKTTVSGDKAFVVTQREIAPGYKVLYLLYLYVVSGTDVYDLSDVSGTSDEPSTKLMKELIQRVQALYPH